MTTTRQLSAVVIGGSTGALDALSTILPRLGAGLPPIVLVVHRLPRGPNALVQVLQSRCPLPVKEAEDKERLIGGTIYVAPPDYHVLIEQDETLALSADDPVCFSRPSIDVLFDSAAEALGKRVAGVLLSGANHDGAVGLDHIQRVGGLAIVQSPESATAAAMPQAALVRLHADHVATPASIAGILMEIVRSASAEARG